MSRKKYVNPVVLWVALSAVIISLIMGVVLRSVWPPIGTLLLIQALLAFSHWKTINKAKTMMKPTCCCHGLAVECVSHHDFQGDMVTFSFKNKEYAQLFKSLNEGKATSAAEPQKTLVA